MLESYFRLFPQESHSEDTTTITPIFRAATADLNTTIALALVSVFATHYFAIKHLGAKEHIGKFINLKSLGGFVLGLFELVQEFSKIISFSFRLFGNIFAGEVLIIVMTSLLPILLPIPFVAIEIFVGLIQALVFAMLTLVFTSMALAHH
jgi:F-type H+-transporting ATPase subunit a